MSTRGSRMKASIFLLLGTLAVLSGLAAAAQGPQLTRVNPPPQTGAIPLYLSPPAGGPAGPEIWDRTGLGAYFARNVSKPTLIPFLPSKEKATGAAVLVAPGGGFYFLVMTDEGFKVAQWLADNGVAAFVLKYRVETSPADEGEFWASFARRTRAPRPAEGAEGTRPSLAAGTALAVA